MAEIKTDALRQAAENAVMYLKSGFTICERCGHQQSDEGSDAELELSEALARQPEADKPQAEPVAVECAQITMGRGLVDVSKITHDGRSGILFRPRRTHRPVGTEGELSPGNYWPAKEDVVIWIETPDGAAVIQEYLSPFLAAPPPAIPAGYALVPIAPTKEMVLAGETALENAIDSDWDSGSDGESYNSYMRVRSGSQTDIWSAMVAAAPVAALAEPRETAKP